MLILYQHAANEWIDVKSLSHKLDAVSYLGYKILQIASFVSLSSHSLIKRCRKSSPLSTLLGSIIKDVYLLMKFSNCEKHRFLFHFIHTINRTAYSISRGFYGIILPNSTRILPLFSPYVSKSLKMKENNLKMVISSSCHYKTSSIFQRIHLFPKKPSVCLTDACIEISFFPLYEALCF